MDIIEENWIAGGLGGRKKIMPKRDLLLARIASQEGK